MFLDSVIKVRRKCYPPSSPAGKGAKWECASSENSSEWHPFDMDIQCLIEEAWSKVNETILLIRLSKMLNAKRKIKHVYQISNFSCYLDYCFNSEMYIVNVIDDSLWFAFSGNE